MMLVTIAKSSDIVAESHMPAPLLNHLFTIYRHLAIDPSCIEVRKELEDHWIATGRRSQHPWNAIRLINLESVDYAYKESQVALASSPNRKELFIKELFGGVRTTHMTMISHNSVTVTEAWLLAIQSLPGLPTIKSLANIDTDNLSFKTDVSHLYSIKKIKR
jgi:hypothetical protein